MRKFVSFIFSVSIIYSLVSCKGGNNHFDATGSFEADEIIVSSENAGIIKQFNVDEGSSVIAGQVIGYIDSLQLYLKKRQLEAQMNALLGKKPNVPIQLASLQEQLTTAEKEQGRVINLVRADAATTKQLDDVNSQVEVLKKQIDAMKSSLNITSAGISNDAEPIEIQIEQLNDLLEKCKIVSPIDGAILVKYAEAGEMTAPGKPLFKVADLSTIILRAYITGDQFQFVKVNKNVKILTDDGNGNYKETTGKITWINEKAEFTPKTIQTKDERANLVYAIKINVKNDGTYKIGMYGEVRFQ